MNDVKRMGKKVWKGTKKAVKVTDKYSQKYGGYVCTGVGFANAAAGVGCNVARTGLHIANGMMNGKRGGRRVVKRTTRRTVRRRRLDDIQLQMLAARNMGLLY